MITPEQHALYAREYGFQVGLVPEHALAVTLGMGAVGLRQIGEGRAANNPAGVTLAENMAWRPSQHEPSMVKLVDETVRRHRSFRVRDIGFLRERLDWVTYGNLWVPEAMLELNEPGSAAPYKPPGDEGAVTFVTAESPMVEAASALLDDEDELEAYEKLFYTASDALTSGKPVHDALSTYRREVVAAFAPPSTKPQAFAERGRLHEELANPNGPVVQAIASELLGRYELVTRFGIDGLVRFARAVAALRPGAELVSKIQDIDRRENEAPA